MKHKLETLIHVENTWYLTIFLKIMSNEHIMESLNGQLLSVTNTWIQENLS